MRILLILVLNLVCWGQGQQQLLVSQKSGGGGGGGGANSDSFTGTDGTALATHDPNWVSLPRGSGDIASCVIQSNQARTTSAFAVCAAMYNASSSDASSLTIVAYTDAVIGKRVCVRGNVAAGADKTGYCAVLGGASAGTWTTVDLVKDGGYMTSLSASAAQGSNHTLKITAAGTSTVTLEVFVDGSSVGTTTDSSSPDGTGKPGFVMVANGDSTVTGVDDWTDAP
jgi:hypothetical protein